MPYTDTDIRDWVGPDTFRRALEVVPHLQDVTWGETGREGDLVATARTPGKQEFDTSLYRMRGVFSSICSCPIRRGCKHAAALGLVVRTRWHGAETEPAAPPEAPNWEERLVAWSEPSPVAAGPRATFCYRLRWPFGPEGEPELQIQVSHATSPAFAALPWHLYRVGADAAEPDQLIEPVLRRVRARRPVFREGATRESTSWLVVPQEAIGELLSRLGLHPQVQDERRRPLTIHATLTLRASLVQRGAATGPELHPVVDGPDGRIAAETVTLLGPPEARWAIAPGAIYRIDASVERAFREPAPIAVPPKERQDFERHWLPKLAEAGILRAETGTPAADWAQGTPRPQLALEEEGDVLHLRVGFVYGQVRVEAEDDGGLVGPGGGPLVRRDAAAEAAWIAALGEVAEGPLRGDAALAFLETAVPSLIEAGWEVVGRDRLNEHRVSTLAPTGRLSVHTGTDWFDIHSELLIGVERVEWQAMQRALEGGARYVRLGSGEWARLPADWLAAQRRRRERFTASAIEADGTLRVPRHQAPVLMALIAEGESFELDEAWHELRARLETFGGIAEAPVSPRFVGALRPYQRQGLSFLSFLRDFGLHGVLADDMGLGKTVQAAALLAANHPSAAGPSLIVAPTSVVANWERELRRFVPSLRVLVLHGPGRDLASIDQYDVVITTYGTARLDLEAHRRLTYHTLILDEAQTIKNPRSQTARAMRRIPARHRLCLTGTPIENDTLDVYSLFAFLMPGMLGDDNAFRARYATPISIGEPAARQELRARIAPFILRRLKSQVATDLPPRTDIIVSCDLTPGQRKVYDMLFTGAQDRIQRAIAEKGIERSRITILDALLKLRQVCCHPALLGTPEAMSLESGKLEAALALIQELVAGGHRALVFSQFTSMLAILRARLDALGLAYEYLDGQTQDRQARVDRFNQGTAPLFLISLKAGGTGLNLTGADYVLHYDPWWNPAAEDQATDRAHRIGQTRSVFNYKLVAKGTIEEKLVRLQSEKRALAQDLLSTDAEGKHLTADDLTALFGYHEGAH